jgi:hypothetical protein
VSGYAEGTDSTVSLVDNGKGRPMNIGKSSTTMGPGSRISVSGTAVGDMQFPPASACNLHAISQADDGKVTTRPAGFLLLLREGMVDCTINKDTSQPVTVCNFGDAYPAVYVSNNSSLDQFGVTCESDPLFEVSVLSGEVDVVVPDGTETTVSAGEELSCDVSECEPLATAVITAEEVSDFMGQSNAPAVSSLSPVSGPPGGGTQVSIAGTGFSDGAKVEFGSQPATDVSVKSTTAIMATSPPGTGSVDVSVSVDGTTTRESNLDKFTYGPISIPQANLTYPNGAIVNFSGTDYVIAGGHAFGVASSSALTALEKVDHATVVTAPSGAIPPSSGPRAGTLLSTAPVNGDSTVYVVGTDGELHSFASTAQLTAFGYDPEMVVPVASVAGLTIGAVAGVLGSAVSALATSADGAIVDSSGSYYIFVGGRAFAIPGPAALATVQASDVAKVLFGTVPSALVTATIANGALLDLSGVLYVSYNGDLWQFESEPQLVQEGYGGTAPVPVPNTGGIAVEGPGEG